MTRSALNNPLPTTSIQPTRGITRGAYEEGNDATVYQFPVTILSEVQKNDMLYTFRVSPFNSPTEEFLLNFAASPNKISYGNCVFNEQGKTTGKNVWSTVDTAEIIKDMNIGDTYLVRLEISKVPRADEVEFVKQVNKKIGQLESKQNIDFLFITTLCKKAI